MLGLMPLAGLLCLLVWLSLLLVTKYVSVSSIGAALTLPLWVWGLGRLMAVHSVPRLILATVIAVIVFVRHLPNIRRLREGREARFRM
jgi:glycerol-3-phosphate acyltransferase PlsY